MPFQSKRQAGYLFANNPKVAQEFADHTPDMKHLPERKKKKKGSGVHDLQYYRMKHKIQTRGYA